jgi:hypothetical protein
MTQIALIHMTRTWVGSLVAASFLSLAQNSPPIHNYYTLDKAGSTILVTRTQHKTPGYHESNAPTGASDLPLAIPVKRKRRGQNKPMELGALTLVINSSR